MPGSLKLLKALKPGNAVGLDNFKLLLPQEFGKETAHTLKVTFECSILTGKLSDWCRAQVALFFKKGYKTPVANYRPISLTCILCKVEHIMVLFVLRFYGPVNPMGSCRPRSVYLTTRLLGRLSPLSG